MDVASLRAEIKAWERDFRSKHTRDPTIQEIKNQPAIAAKYKLYKSLSKASSSAPITGSSTAPPSTPPRSQPRQTTQSATPSLLPKARAVKVDPPVQTSNPFSPVKKKSKLKHDAIDDTNQSLRLMQNTSRMNPFTTPTKPKAPSKPKPSAPQRSLSPDPFPPIQSSQSAQQRPEIPLAPAGHSAVTRARKRLRGEPVSPSPVKEKRARVGSQRALNFAGPSSDSDDDNTASHSRTAQAGDDTFMEATPMKPPPGGKSFRLLFDEVLPDSQDTSRQPANRALSRTKSVLNKTGIFGDRRAKSRALSPSSSEDEDVTWEKGTKLKGLITSSNRHALAKKLHTQQNRMINGTGKHGFPKAVLPGRDDLWSDVGPSKGPLLKNQTRALSNARGGGETATRSATKRPLPDEQPDHNPDGADGLTNGGDAFLRLPLIPPSPPPADSSAKSYTGGAKDKGKGKAAAAAFSRKKARLLEQVGGEGDDDSGLDDEDEVRGVKELDRTKQGRRPNTEFLNELDDSEFEWPPHPVHPPESPPLMATSVDPGSVDIHLPDDLKRILALSPNQEGTKEEDQLVKELLYGRREKHYDAKGGEIWDVGEISEGADGAEGEGEEDWEGEPVPWEIGEL